MSERANEQGRDRIEVMSKWVHVNLFDHLEKDNREYRHALQTFQKYVKHLGSRENVERAYEQVKLQLQVEDLKPAERGMGLRLERLNALRRWFEKEFRFGPRS